MAFSKKASIFKSGKNFGSSCAPVIMKIDRCNKSTTLADY